MIANTGYEVTHAIHLGDREAALADLRKCADRARENLSSGRGNKKRDAR
jgi:hypothetical protein